MRRTIVSFIIITIIAFFSFTNGAMAQTNSTEASPLPEMFNPAIDKTNSYHDPNHIFSILPPSGWVVKSQSNGNESAMVVFSNQNPQSLANFAIYYNKGNPISSSILGLPDSMILDQSIAELFNMSQTQMLQKNIQRFSDGFVMQYAFAPQPATKNSPINEEFLFWLDDGRQYYLVLVSDQNGFEQNAVDFERSAYTFYVEPKNTSGSQYIPSWIKNIAKLWSEGSIDDNTFVSAIQYMAKNGIIKVTPSPTVIGPPSNHVPAWVKNNAGWWANGSISDDEFAKGIQYLVSNGIIGA